MGSAEKQVNSMPNGREHTSEAQEFGACRRLYAFMEMVGKGALRWALQHVKGSRINVQKIKVNSRS